jgi:hypothetical protein
LIALACAVGVLLSAWVAWEERGFPSWLCAIVAILIAIGSLHRFQKERALLAGCVATITAVTFWEKTDNDDGNAYEVKYRFLAQDGKEYIEKKPLR